MSQKINTKLWITTGLSLLLLGLMTAPAMGAAFLKFDGVDSEATSEGHDKWIDILSFSQSVALPVGSSSGGSSRPTGASERTPFVVAKVLDKTSPQLAQSCVSGEKFTEVLIDLATTGSKKTIVYMQYKLSNVFIASYSVSGNSDDRPTEEIALNYEKIEWKFIEVDNTGNPKPGGQHIGSWDFATNQPIK